MSRPALRVGIAGYGVVGKRRQKFIDSHPRLAVVAMSDITFESEGVDSDGRYRYKNYEGLFEQDLDVLFVSLPNNIAAISTVAGLEMGLHVFCEKPPGRLVEDIRKVIRTERAHPHLKLKYGFNHRYHESVKKAKTLIDGGCYGKILNLRGVYGKSRVIPFTGGWRSERDVAGGGILLDQGIHMIDMIRHFAGDFDEIKSFISSQYWGHDVEDNAFAMLRNQSGCIAMLHSTATQWRHKFRLEVTLESALIELTGILSGSKTYGEEKLTFVTRDSDSTAGSFAEETTLYLDDNSWRDEVYEFADLILQDRKVENGSSEDALKVMELVYGIYYADESWRKKWKIQDPNEG